MTERTFPPPIVKPGSSKIREGCKMNSRDHGAFTRIGAATSGIRRAFLRSNISLVIGWVLELNATTSKMTRANCQSTITINANGENAHTIANRTASHQVFRQLKFSSCSRPNKALTNHGPTTTKTTVPSLPLLIAVKVVGEKA